MPSQRPAPHIQVRVIGPTRDADLILTHLAEQALPLFGGPPHLHHRNPLRPPLRLRPRQHHGHQEGEPLTTAAIPSQVLPTNMWELPTAEIPPILLRPEQAARALNLSRSTVFELIRRGELRSVKSGASRRISAAAIREYVARLEEAEAA